MLAVDIDRLSFARQKNCRENIDMSWEDPIVKEVREVRDQVAARYQYDVRAIGRHYQQKQEQGKRVLVTLPPRLVDPDAKANLPK